MTKAYTADLIITNDGPPIKNGWITLDESGLITSVNDSRPPHDALKFDGVIVPGFVNAHCHLELSHLKGVISPQSGMAGFIQQLLKNRFVATASEQQKAMHLAEQEMLQNGIVAVGDISNNESSILIKQQRKLYYHTFIEIVGLNPALASEIYQKGIELRDLFNSQLNTNNSIVPHAPYSMSDALLTLFSNEKEFLYPATIHSEESLDEFELCKYKKGPIAELFDSMGIDLKNYFPNDEVSPLEKVVPFFKDYEHFQFVHNTFTKEASIEFAETIIKNAYWCFCPNANKYITNTQPNYNLFYKRNSKVTIGTDSLASNNQLCILSELHTIQKEASTIPFTTLIEWATKNGADFLGLSDTFGSIKIGNMPGIVLLENINSNSLLISDSTTTRRLDILPSDTN
jgi:cytosine/adenosine deaminase-related metal-dependent hydrolase